MTITAKIIADSISEQGIRLTTFQLRYPRFIHAEFMTHRHFSRNASSSRAVPVEKLIDDIMRDPAMPIHWGRNQKGMQANEELTSDELLLAKTRWMIALNGACHHAKDLMHIGAHKQIVNRLLEPFSHINVVCTATEWTNFYGLRRHKDAQPEIRALADAMYCEHHFSTPYLLMHGEWHLPYIEREDLTAVEWHLRQNRITRDMPPYRESVELLKKVSAARCARTSYLTFEGKRSTVQEDLTLCEKLIKAELVHASPFEHQATPDTVFATHDEGDGSNPEVLWDHPELHGNLRGWIQNRKQIPNECIH